MTAPSASGAFRLDHHISTAAELLRRNRLAEAKEELESALAIDAESVRAQALYGLTLFRSGAFEQALPIYEKLTEIASDDAAYHLNLGLVRLKLADAEGAVVALERSRDLDPSQGRAVNYLGLAYARGGRFAEAYRAFLVAGQVDLAREIADNLDPAERASIEASLRRPAAGGGKPPPRADAAAPRSEQPAAVIPPSAAKPAAPAPRPALPPLPRPGSRTSPPPTAAPGSAATPTAAPGSGPTPAAAPGSQPAPAAAPAEPTVLASPPPPAASGTARAEEDDDELVLSIEAEPAASGSMPTMPLAEPAVAAPSPAAAEPAAGADDELDFSPSVSSRFVASADPRNAEPMSAREPEPTPPSPPTPARRSLRHATASGPRPAIESSPALIIDDQGAISRAVADAAPSTAGAATTRASTGARGPQPLSEFATARLVRPEDGDQPFELAAGGFLIVRVSDRMFSRTEGVDVTGGALTYEPALRRARGQSRGEPFATGGRPMFQVTGKGHLIAAPLGGQFTAVSLDDDILYLREDLLFAFEPLLRWENGHVPGSRATIPMVQFRGTGAIAFRTVRPLLTVKLAADKVLYVDAAALAGWIGRVLPRAVTADAGGAAELFVECSGEGVVLVEEPPPLP